MAMTVTEYQFLLRRFFDFNSFEEDDGPATTCCFDTLLLFVKPFALFRFNVIVTGAILSTWKCDSRLSTRDNTQKGWWTSVSNKKIKINRQIQKANMTNKKINKQSELFKRLERSFGTAQWGCEEMEMRFVIYVLWREIMFCRNVWMLLAMCVVLCEFLISF